jgi:hypothetical protein
MDEYHLTKEKGDPDKLIQGLSYKQIASECSIAKETLNTHMKISIVNLMCTPKK